MLPAGTAATFFLPGRGRGCGVKVAKGVRHTLCLNC